MVKKESLRSAPLTAEVLTSEAVARRESRECDFIVRDGVSQYATNTVPVQESSIPLFECQIIHFFAIATRPWQLRIRR
jgi:hypothetical protein